MAINEPNIIPSRYAKPAWKPWAEPTPAVVKTPGPGVIIKKIIAAI
jgi:hypothetical protein